MESATASRQPLSPWVPALGCALAGAAVFQFFGNATRGWVATDSMFWWWVSQWLDPNAEAEHGWLILGLSGWLLWRNLRSDGRQSRILEHFGKARSDEPTPPSVIEDLRARLGEGEASLEITNAQSPIFAATVAMGSGLALNAAGFVAQQTRLGIVGFLVFTWGVLALGGGRRWARAAGFPLAFMAFAVPLNVLDTVGFWLRLSVVDTCTSVAHAAGLQIVRNGTQLFAPDGSYQYDVAAACSGVRSLMALAALSLLIGYLNFRGWGRRGLMLALCFPLTYLGNLARIGSIIVAAQWGGQKWGERAHDVMGYGIFVIVLGGVLAAAEILRRWRPEAEDRVLSSEFVDRGADGPGRRPYLVAVGVVVLAVGEMFFLGHLRGLPARGGAGVRLAADGVNPVDLPAFVGTEWIGRRAEVTAVERDILPADTGFSRRNYVAVSGGQHSVFLSVVLSGRDRTSIHRPEICLVGQGWTITGTARHRFAWPGGGEVPATLLRITRTDGRTGRPLPGVVAYWFVNADAVAATHWERFMRDAWNRLRHGRADRWAYVLVQADAADGEAAALARMQEVLAGTLTAFQRAP